MPISTFLKKPPLLLVVLALLTLSGLSLWLYGNKKNPGHTLRLSGHLEATETDLAFKIPGKIAFIHFEEGQTVKAGEVVAELESQDLSQEVAMAEGRLGAAQANLAKLQAGFRRQEVRQAQAALAQARADLEEKQRDYCRLENLYQRRVVAASVRDKAEAAFLMAKELWRQAQEKFALAKEGYRREDIAAALSEAKQAQAALALARTRLGYATLISPMTGVVLKRPAEPGEVVAVGSTVITLGDLDHIWFEGYIPETDLARVRHGQRAAITTDTYPGKQYPAWVSYIAAKAEFTPKSVETFKERVTLVYRTKIRCDNPHHELKPGMPAEAVIFLEPAADQKGS